MCVGVLYFSTFSRRNLTSNLSIVFTLFKLPEIAALKIYEVLKYDFFIPLSDTHSILELSLVM